MTYFSLAKFLSFIFLVTFMSLPVFSQTNEQIESQIAVHLNNLEKWAYRTGTGDFDALGKENNILRKELIKYAQDASLLDYDFPKLKEKMFIATSKDRKLRSYSWDNQQGGSGRLFESVFQYLDKAGKAHTSSYEMQGEGIVCSYFTHQIYQLDTSKGRIYLTISTSACSNSLLLQSLSLSRIDGKKLNSDLELIKTSSGLTNSISFECDFFSVVDHPERPVNLFKFDETKKEFSFPVVIEDAEMPQGRVTDKSITYRFNGRYFVKVK